MNSGTIIKILAVIMTVILILMLTIALVTAIDSYDYNAGYTYMGQRGTEVPAQVWIFYIAGILFSLCFGLVLYGFGALIDSNISINRKMDQLITNAKQPQAPQMAPVMPQGGYVYTPPVSAPIPAAPVVPAPVQNVPVAPAPAPMAPIVDEPTMVFPVLGDLNQENPVVDVPVAEEPTGWTCSNCGAQYPTLTPFCRNCGHKRV